MEGKRFSQLDSLRGITALLVVFCHIELVAGRPFLHSFWLELSPLRWLIEGTGAVIFFFVLSGYVLSLPYIRGKQPKYLSYIVKRFFRLYLPSLASLLFAGWLWWFFASGSSADFPTNPWGVVVSQGDFLRHILMTGVEPTEILNAPLWSLVIEIRAAFIFPFMYFFVARYGWKGVLGASVLGVLCGYFALWNGDTKWLHFAETALGSFLTTIYYLPFFMFGILLAVHSDKMVAFYQRQTESTKRTIFWYFLLFPAVSLNSRVLWIVEDYWFAIIGVSILICALASEKFQTVLHFPFIAWLGKVSFSLYIIHQPVLYAFLYTLGDVLPHYVVYLIFLPTVFVLSEITYVLVERPSKNLGYYVAGKIDRKRDQ